ncbi:MAG: DUF1566 domain-containing protein, partial [Pseudomonadota bacterium]
AANSQLEMPSFFKGVQLCLLTTIFLAIPSAAQNITPIISALLLGDEGVLATGLLNDTGITFGGNYSSGNNTGCTGEIVSRQDCSNGRDVTENDNTDGDAGFSFTKLDANGDPLADQSDDYSTTPWTCVKDNVTGLVWEVKTNDASIHNFSNIYKWGGVTVLGSGYGTYHDDWDTLVNGSNANNFCGFNDWRVPTRQELESLVHFNETSPSIDSNYFPNTSTSYWTASPSAANSVLAWYVNFIAGTSLTSSRDNPQELRLVRSAQ